MKSTSKPKNPPSLILRSGLGFVFLYAAIESLLHPLEWSGFLPSFLVQTVSPTLALHMIAISEVILALWLFSGKHRKYAAALSALTLGGIILTNLSQFIITFRDVGLLCASLALYFIDD